MKYNKPEVTVLGSAIDAVQSSSKTAPFVTELISPYTLAHTANAYEADE